MVSGPVGADQIFLEGLRFVQIPGGTYTLGDVRKNSFPVIFSTGNFFIASDEVSCALYGRFLEENPEYGPENRGKLVEEGKVSEDYLQDWETLKGSKLPVSSVSYYAASAYCSWLASKLPERMQDSHTVRLPQEYEWEVAALFSDTADPVLFETGIDGPRPVGTGRQSAAGVDGSVLKNMYGNLWEWCDNWYGANNFIYYDWKGNYRNRQTYPALEKCVRGGSWAVMQELVTIRSRGSQPAQWCTPFLGFRPVIVQK
jgi:formylglycine-generating enzyme required for sulfatase activity